MRALVNPSLDVAGVPAPSKDAIAFHAGLAGYAATPLRVLTRRGRRARHWAALAVKDESARFGLPAFKVLGASWAVERALREHPGVDTLVDRERRQPRAGRGARRRRGAA